MREGFKFGLRTLGKYLVLFLLSLMFVGTMIGQLWLQTLLNLVFLAGFALLTFSEAGTLGERAETLRFNLEGKRAAGGKTDPEAEAKAYRPATAVIGFFVASAPLLIIALLNLASLPSSPQSLDPENFALEATAAPDAAIQQDATLFPDVTVTPVAGVAPEATPVPDAAPLSETPAPNVLPEATPAPGTNVQPEVSPALGDAAQLEATPAPEAESLPPPNLFNTVARLTFSPFIALYGLLNNQLLLLYILMVPLSFFLPAFALAGYLRGPKLRLKKLEAIKKGIRAKKRKERQARKPSGPKPEV